MKYEFTFVNALAYAVYGFTPVTYIEAFLKPQAQSSYDIEPHTVHKNLIEASMSVGLSIVGASGIKGATTGKFESVITVNL